MHNSAAEVIINNAGPRAGLQNNPASISLADRLKLIDNLAAAGVPAIEAGSFVSPKAGTDREQKEEARRKRLASGESGPDMYNMRGLPIF